MLDLPDIDALVMGSWRPDLGAEAGASDSGLAAVASKSTQPHQEGDDGSHGSAEESREASEFNTFIHGVGSSPIDALESVLQYFDVDDIYDLVQAPSYTPRGTGPCDERFDPDKITGIPAAGNCDTVLPAINKRIAGIECARPFLNCDPCTEGLDLSNPFNLPDADLDCLREDCLYFLDIPEGRLRIDFTEGDAEWEALPQRERDPIERFMTDLWNLLQDNADIVLWLACLVGGETRRKCMERRLDRSLTVDFQQQPPAAHEGATMWTVGHRNHLVKVNAAESLFLGWVGTNRVDSQPWGSACALVWAAGSLLHELTHTCTHRGAFHAFRALSGRGHDDCDETVLMQNSFYWAMAQRYPCLTASPACTWMTDPCAWMNYHLSTERTGLAGAGSPC